MFFLFSFLSSFFLPKMLSGRLTSVGNKLLFSWISQKQIEVQNISLFPFLVLIIDFNFSAEKYGIFVYIIFLLKLFFFNKLATKYNTATSEITNTARSEITVYPK